MLGKLLDKLRGSPRPQVRLIVRGRVVECGEHTPRTHLGPKQAAPEAWFGLQISHARLSAGTALQAADIVPAEFSGDIGLLQDFAVGAEVEITATTATGRLIDAMVAV